MTPASLDELLKEWETEAMEKPSGKPGTVLRHPLGHDIKDERILSLIAGFRKQREALRKVYSTPSSQQEFIYEYKPIIDEALVEAERILKG